MSAEVFCKHTILGELCTIVRGREVLLLHTKKFLKHATRALLVGQVVRGGQASGLFRELEEYFRGERRAFSYKPRLPGEEPSLSVFQEVLRIPYGEVSTYGRIAKRTGLSPRVIGRILGRNPVLILIPCHRVVGSRGLGGYALGLEKKRFLLRIEGL